MGFIFFTTFITTVLLLFGIGILASEHNGDITCPSCEELERRKAGINESDICHHYYEYICVEDPLLVKVHSHQIIPFSANSSTTKQSNVTKLVAQKTELICYNTKLENVTYIWKRNDVLVSKILNLKIRSQLADDGSLHIDDLHSDDSGKYSCAVFRGPELIHISSVYLNVEYTAMVVSSPKQYMTLGKPSVLNCYYTANPSVKFVTWIKDDKLFDTNTTGVSMLQNGSLLFENPSTEHEGIYRCTPYNIHGTHGSSEPMQVVVKDKLHSFAIDDLRVEEIHKEELRKNSENLFTHRKRYKSRLVKLAKTNAKSSFVFKEVNETHADIKMLNQTLFGLFSKQRNEFFDLKHKENIRKTVIQVFQSYSLNTEIQKFNCESYHKGKYVTFEAKNLIGILPSPNFGKPGDKIFVIGGHYDTVYRNPGVDDNGSGSAHVLEVSRLLSKQRNKLNATIYFVLFDQEESGLEGSIAFVDDYLVPKVIDKRGAVFIGAYIADMLLLYDPNEDVQTLPYDVQKMCPEAYNWITNNSFRGDFVSVWARNADMFLWNTLKESWNELSNDHFKILLLNAPLAADFRNVSAYHRSTTFSRSDHASLWSSARQNPHITTLPAVLLNDMGPWRGYQRRCYHQPCDNAVQLTDTNLQFLAKTVDAVVASVLKLVGDTQQPNENSVLV